MTEHEHSLSKPAHTNASLASQNSSKVTFRVEIKFHKSGTIHSTELVQLSN